jgi:hypothetical protein
MGVSPASCTCSKSCKDTPNEFEFTKGDYLRSRSGNIKIQNEFKNNENNSKSKTRSSLFKSENLDSKEINNYKNNDKIKSIFTFDINSKEKLEQVSEENNNIKIEEQKEENKNKINPKNATLKYLPNFDKIYFFPKKLLNAEKLFTCPINYETDYQKYYKEDEDNIDLIILINTMNKNKGTNRTKDNGEVFEYDCEKYLYIGETDKNQMPTGFGVLYTQGQKYEGNFFRGKLIGLGRYINEEGKCFEGIFEDNKLVSKGTIIALNKNNKRVEYFGDVIDFKKNGKGEEICEDEYRYNGDFSNDMKHGFGILEFFESDETYEGQFDKGEITGRGIYTWSNGEKYEGSFVKGIKHGMGIYKWPDGCIYEGEYNNGIREGKGKYIWEDGRIFIGMFLNGKPNGKGRISYKNKTAICEYKNGKPAFDVSKLFKNS